MPLAPDVCRTLAASIARSLFGLAHRDSMRLATTGDDGLSRRDRRFHACMRESLRAQRFQELGYFQTRGNDEQSLLHAVYRHESGQVGAVVVVVTPTVKAGWLRRCLALLLGTWPKPGFLLMLGTRFIDGGYVETITGGGAELTHPPHYDLLCMPAGTSFDVQLAQSWTPTPIGVIPASAIVRTQSWTPST